MSAPAPLSGADLRAWRRAWGMQARELGPLLCYEPPAISMMERRPEVPAVVAAYVAAHPPPPEDPTYPPTREGFAAALAAHGLGSHRFARWWGVGYMGVWHWLHGNAVLPLPVQTWLRAGAPRSGRIPFPPPLGTDTLPRKGSRLRRPRRPLPPPEQPGGDWVWLSKPRGWVPPAGICKPGESFGALDGCAVCAHRQQCRALSARAS